MRLPWHENINYLIYLTDSGFNILRIIIFYHLHKSVYIHFHIKYTSIKSNRGKNDDTTGARMSKVITNSLPAIRVRSHFLSFSKNELQIKTLMQYNLHECFVIHFV